MRAKLYIILLCVIPVISCNLGTPMPLITIPENTPTTAVVSASPDATKDYIGLIYPPFPENLKKGPSMMFSPPQSDQRWVVIIIKDGDLFMLWFEKILYDDKDGEPHVQVSDILILPHPVQGQSILVDQCMHAGILDSEIVVLAHVDEENIERRYLPNSNIVQAWRANQTTGRFATLSTTNIDCYAETFLEYPWWTP